MNGAASKRKISISKFIRETGLEMASERAGQKPKEKSYVGHKFIIQDTENLETV